MLSSLRGFLGNFFVLFLLGLLIASFAIWGIGDVFRQTNTAVATVGEAEVTDVEFQQSFQNRLRVYQQQFGPEFTQQQAVSLGLHQSILGELVQRTALDEEARILGVRGTDEKIRDSIREMEAFHDFSGNFNRQNYEFALTQAGYNVQSFEATLRTDLARQQLLNTVSAAKIVPQSLVEELYVFRKEQRTADILSIPASAITDVPEADEETLKQYHENNSGQFMTPEYRNIAYVVLKSSDFTQDLTISEEDIQEEYNLRIDEYNIPEKRTLDMVSFMDEKSAQDFYDRVQAGEDFMTLATELTGFGAEEISIGTLTQDEVANNYNQSIASTVFETGVDDLTGPQQTLLGSYIFRVTAVEAGESKELEDVREELVEAIRNRKGADGLYDLIGRVDDELASGAELDTLSTDLQLDLVRVPAIDRSGLDPEGNLIRTDDIDLVLAQAFDNAIDTDIQVYEASADTFYLVQVYNITAPEVRAFETVTEEVAAAWKAQEQVRLAGERADEALTKARDGVALQTLALEYGGTIINTPLIIRDQIRNQRDVSPTIANLMFSLEKGKVDMERAATGDGYVLVRVTDVIPGHPESDPLGMMALQQQLATEIENDILGQFSYAVQQAVPVSVNNRRVQELVNPEVLPQ